MKKGTLFIAALILMGAISCNQPGKQPAGNIPQEQKELLLGMEAWLKVNWYGPGMPRDCMLPCRRTNPATMPVL